MSLSTKILTKDNISSNEFYIKDWVGEKPIEIDIGFGRGYFLLARAAQNPEVNFVGFEIKQKWLNKVYEKSIKLGLNNIFLCMLDARLLLSKIKPDEIINRFSINFPDPWWKKRHNKRRVISFETIKEITRLLKPGGEIFIQTDVDDRAEDYFNLLELNCNYENISQNGKFMKENPFNIISHREKKCIELKESIYRIYFRKKGEINEQK